MVARYEIPAFAGMTLKPIDPRFRGDDFKEGGDDFKEGGDDTKTDRYPLA